MRQSTRTFLTFIIVVSFVGSIYYFWPGFEHLFTVGTGAQPTMGVICVIAFLMVVLTFAQLSPYKRP